MPNEYTFKEYSPETIEKYGYKDQGESLDQSSMYLNSLSPEEHKQQDSLKPTITSGGSLRQREFPRMGILGAMAYIVDGIIPKKKSKPS
jgi:hypothetical protein